jgi:hypothetical protein
MVTVDNSHPANVIRQDAIVAMDGAGTITTPAFSTTGDNELLVAFVAYDGPSNSAQTATVSGAGLTWRLVKRSNTQGGTAEIWSTGAPNPVPNVTVISQPGVGGSSYHGSMTVIAFTNASGVGIVGQASAPSGAPDIFLPGISAGNWVFAVGNDWDRAVARTAATGQVLVHQKVDTRVGDTYWVQSTTAPSAANALVERPMELCRRGNRCDAPVRIRSWASARRNSCEIRDGSRGAAAQRNSRVSNQAANRVWY